MILPVRRAMAALGDIHAAVDSPGKADVGHTAEQLAKARSVLVRFRAVGNLPLPVPDGPLALELERTPEALARYRLAGPAGDGTQPLIGQEVKDALERLLRSLGVQPD